MNDRELLQAVIRGALRGAVAELKKESNGVTHAPEKSAKKTRWKHGPVAKVQLRRGRPPVPPNVVREMRRMRSFGMSAKKIGKKLGLSHFTVYKYTKS
jgi:DNA invertase Pin-like site-specific DNA recombinase